MLAWAAMFLGYYHIHVMCFIPNRHFFNFILPIELKQTKSRASSFSSVEQKSRASSFSSEEQSKERKKKNENLDFLVWNGSFRIDSRTDVWFRKNWFSLVEMKESNYKHSLLSFLMSILAIEKIQY